MPVRKHDLYYSGPMCTASAEKKTAAALGPRRQRSDAAAQQCESQPSWGPSRVPMPMQIRTSASSSRVPMEMGCVCAGGSVCESHVPLASAGLRYTVLQESCSQHHVSFASLGVCNPRARGHEAGRPSPTSSHTRKLISNAHGTQQVLPRPFSRFLLMKSSHLEHRLPMIRPSLWTTNAKFTNLPTRATEIRKFH